MSTSPRTQQFHPILSEAPPFTLEVGGVEAVTGEGVPRRNAQYVDGLVALPEEGVATVFDIVVRAARRFGSARAVGSRRLIATHRMSKKVTKIVDGRETLVDKEWSFFEMSEYAYLSYVEYEQQVLQIGAGLRNLGLVKGDRLFLFAATSARWLITAHGAVSQSMPFVTAYDTLGEEAIRLSLLATQPKVVFLDPQLIRTLSNTLKSIKTVKTVIYNDDHELREEDMNRLKNTNDQLQIFSFEELRKLGEVRMVDPVPPLPDDLCCIMYTSGSTGTPKGVQLKHENIIGAVAGVNTVAGQYIGPNDSILSYLPLAHIFEFVLENTSLFWGTLLGYGSARTLSDASMRNCKGDIRELRPTLMIGVPTVWEQIRKGVIAKVAQQGFVARNVFWAALAAKSWMLKRGVPGWGMWDHAVFSKVREATGGRLRLIANGAGPISKDTLRFLSLVVSPMINGYGMTETCGMGGLGNPMRWTEDAIGDIPACVEVKLVDFPDAGYFSNSQPPQGEIWIRGTSVMGGYFEDDQQTADTLTPDGWLKTGDIGEWDKNGHLKIIDRKKNLVKTMKGEYIALEKLESIYRTSPLVSNICVHASPDRATPLAIVSTSESAMQELAVTRLVTSPPTDGPKGVQVDDARLEEMALAELQAVGRRGGLSGIEIVTAIMLTRDEWTPQNGLVTPAMKLNRRNILHMYKKEIDASYERFPEGKVRCV